MKKLFANPVMSISLFNGEDVVTTSVVQSGVNGTPLEPGSIDGDTYKTATASWNDDTLKFTF